MIPRPQPSAAAPVITALGGFLALAIALGIGRFVYTPILPYMTSALDLSKSEAGLIASANFLGYLAGALLLAWTNIPGSRRFWMAAALMVSAATTACMAGGTSLAFAWLRFAAGIASAVVMVFASALVLERLTAMNRPSLLALPYAGVGGGIAVSAIVVSFVPSSDNDWEPLWLATGLLSAVLIPPVVWCLRAPDLGASRCAGNGNEANTMPHGRRLLWYWIIAYGLFGFGYVITATFIADMMRVEPELREGEHLAWLLVGLAAMPSVAFWTWLGRARGNGLAFAVACLLEAVGVALAVLTSNIGLLLVSAGLLGGTFMGLTALGLIEIRRLSAWNPRQGLAMMTASFGLGQMIGPTLAGDLHDRLGSYLWPSLLAVAALVIAALMTGALGHLHPKRSA